MQSQKLLFSQGGIYHGYGRKEQYDRFKHAEHSQ